MHSTHRLLYSPKPSQSGQWPMGVVQTILSPLHFSSKQCWRQGPIYAKNKSRDQAPRPKTEEARVNPPRSTFLFQSRDPPAQHMRSHTSTSLAFDPKFTRLFKILPQAINFCQFGSLATLSIMSWSVGILCVSLRCVLRVALC